MVDIILIERLKAYMQNFFKLIDQYNEADPENTQIQIDKIWATYGIEKSIFVLDMSGFSLLVQRHGIIHYLGMVRRMQLAVEPIVEKFHGHVVKFEADNCFAVFDEPKQAIQAAIAINIALDAMNTMTQDNKDLRVSIGISHGKILLVEHQDYFGDAVNLASKLGEDIAQAQEILLTQNAYDKLGDNAKLFELEDTQLLVSGLELKAYKVIF